MQTRRFPAVIHYRLYIYVYTTIPESNFPIGKLQRWTECNPHRKVHVSKISSAKFRNISSGAFNSFSYFLQSHRNDTLPPRLLLNASWRAVSGFSREQINSLLALYQIFSTVNRKSLSTARYKFFIRALFDAKGGSLKLSDTRRTT